MVRVNKKRVSWGRLEKVIKQLDKKYSIRLGLLGENGSKQVEGTDMDMAALGAVHEFGATINHPGGTPYLINEDGTATFVSKDKGAKLPKTQPHEIIIPTRSFLRMPLLSSKGKREVIKEVVKSLELGSALKNDKNTPEEFRGSYEKEIINLLDPKTLATAIGSAAYNRVMQAFETNGFGNWEPTKTDSRKQRKGSPDNPTLVDTGNMRDSITFEVEEVS